MPLPAYAAALVAIVGGDAAAVGLGLQRAIDCFQKAIAFCTLANSVVTLDGTRQDLVATNWPFVVDRVPDAAVAADVTYGRRSADDWSVVLPDMGVSAFYRQNFADAQRLDIDFVPNANPSTPLTEATAEELCRELRSLGLSTDGDIAALRLRASDAGITVPRRAETMRAEELTAFFRTRDISTHGIRVNVLRLMYNNLRDRERAAGACAALP